MALPDKSVSIYWSRTVPLLTRAESLRLLASAQSQLAQQDRKEGDSHRGSMG